MRRCLYLAMVLIVASSGSTAVTTTPVAAATNCYTWFSNNNPGMSTFTIYYRNCSSGGSIAVTPYWAFSNRVDGVGIYGACRSLAYQQMTSWTVTAPYANLNFGVARCHPEPATFMHVYQDRGQARLPCWMNGPVYSGALATIEYKNCEPRTVEVFPYVVEGDGDIVGYLFDGPAVLAPRWHDPEPGGDGWLEDVATWNVEVGPYFPLQRMGIAWAWPYP